MQASGEAENLLLRAPSRQAIECSRSNMPLLGRACALSTLSYQWRIDSLQSRQFSMTGFMWFTFVKISTYDEVGLRFVQRNIKGV
jgi:hypothetical protein